MKMIGMGCVATRCCCNSRPSIPGIETSRIAQDTFWKLRGVQEIAGRGEDRSTEPDQREQTLESFAERLIVIDDRD